MDSLLALRDRLRKFAKARDWDQFHSPKNLACALAVESGELLETFTWLPEDESANLAPEKREQVSHEIADVLIYLVRLADKLEIDPVAAVEQKMVINEQKYPVQAAFGTSKKYTEL